MASRPLAGKVCIVTGATRGIGKGIALQLAEAGATVYITGRTLTAPKDSKLGGSLTDTASEIEARGGKCIPVQCDHSNDSDVEKLFEKVGREQNGQLDILVNNAYSAVSAITDSMGKPFWEQPLSMWDTVNTVGLRNHYLCSIHAAKLMVPRKQGLIANISSVGGLRYLFNIPYGMGKAAVDRMAADCGFELRKHNVAFVSVWPGLVKTEFISLMKKTAEENPSDSRVSSLPMKLVETAETPEYCGRCVVGLATDPNLMQKSGKIQICADLGAEYGFIDVNGKCPSNMRQLNYIMSVSPKSAWLGNYIPNFVKIPKWLYSFGGHKL